jgi:hypothetical protein
MFPRKLACTAVSAHNIHEGGVTGRVQEGGTGTICFGESTGFIHKTGRDSEGLGRWSWILLGGMNGHRMCIITAYNPCRNKKVMLGTTYQQQQRYFITRKKYLTCPIVLFRMHLIMQFTKWRAEGNPIVLFMDHNEHFITGHIGKAMSNKEGPDLREAIV